MSRIRSRNQEWQDLGPTGCRTEPRRYVHGSLVVPGPRTGPAPYIMPIPLKGEELAEARRRFHPHRKTA